MNEPSFVVLLSLDRLELLGMNQSWSMDFVADQLFNGSKFRSLTVVDNFSRKCLAIRAGQSLRGTDVVDTMNQIVKERDCLPVRIQVDNGSEFISKDLISGLMIMASRSITPGPENQRIIRTLNHSMVASEMNV